MGEKDSLDKLLVYQQELQAEEKCLRKIIAKLNEQTHALQVEQLHILSAINKSSKANSSPNESNVNNSEVNMKKEAIIDPESIKLDLDVPKYQSCEEDEDEMDE